MAKNTDISLRNKVIYSVYVRNHTNDGTFNAVADDLDRIKSLGTDIIWFMPIHPIGVKNKKGSLGCPYANKDYRTTNPEYGTMDDFKNLVEKIHAKSMKCMIDVVYNHTSPDSNLSVEHPEFFYRKPDGNFGNKVGDWSDIIDLDYSNKELWKYQIDSLVMWAKIVDGFRCDVASFVPVEFWKQAREAVAKVNPDCIWLAESVHSSFNVFSRKSGIYTASDYELFDAFDMEYDYDIREVFDKYLKGKTTLSNYMDMFNYQEAIYPQNYDKMRCLENHDQPRICHYVKNRSDLENYTAFLYFLKGSTLIYAGQEFGCDETPSLFDKDVFPRNTGIDISSLLAKLDTIKKTVLDDDDYFRADADDENDIAIFERDNNKSKKVGIFSLKSKSADVKVDLPDGDYKNVASFVAVLPANDPEILVYVMLDDPNNARTDYSSILAAPVAGNIISEVAPYLGIATDGEDRSGTIVTVPNLVGTEWSNAQVQLNIQGLKHQLQESQSSQSAAPVTYQYPHAGSKVPYGTTIYLYTDTYEGSHTEVPDVTGKSPDFARQMLSAAGLNCVVEGSGTVQAQSAEPGSSVQRGTIITLTCG